MKSIVVDDSRLARERLMAMLAKHPELEVIGSADRADSALLLIEKNDVDVIFLDIHMPGKSGFDFLAKLNYSPYIIFTTAFSEHAVRSFDFNTVDYLLKPISTERLAAAIEKLYDRKISADTEDSTFDTAGSAASTDESPMEIDSRVFIKDNDECFLVDLRSIYYFETCGNYVRIFFDDRSAFIKKTLNSLEQRLPVKHFFRANRKHIINLKAIDNVEPWITDGYRLTLKGDVTIDVSRRHALRLKELLSF